MSTRWYVHRYVLGDGVPVADGGMRITIEFGTTGEDRWGTEEMLRAFDAAMQQARNAAIDPLLTVSFAHDGRLISQDFGPYEIEEEWHGGPTGNHN